MPVGKVPARRIPQHPASSVSEADKRRPHADLAADLAVSKFQQINPLKVAPSDQLQPGRAIFNGPGSIDAAMETVLFRADLDDFAINVSQTTSASKYLRLWDSFIAKFTERAFLASYFLYSAKRFNEPPLEEAALREIQHLHMLTRSASAFVGLDKQNVLRETWPFDFIGMQLEGMNNVLVGVGSYPEIVQAYRKGRFSADTYAQRRGTVLEWLSKLTDPIAYLRRMQCSERHFTSLSLDLPEESVDTFTSYPVGDPQVEGEPEMDVQAVRKNADAFIALRRVLDSIMLQAGRKRGKEVRLSVRWNDDRGTLTIEDRNPGAGALLPFMNKDEQNRLQRFVKEMGEDSAIRMFPAVVNTTVGKIVIRLPRNLLPTEEASAYKAAALAKEGFASPSTPPAADEFSALDACFAEFEGSAPPPSATPVPDSQAAIASGLYAVGGMGGIIKP